MKKVALVEMMIDVARTLFDGSDGQDNVEYARGVCEVLGRIEFDLFRFGDGTCENADAIARMLGVRITEKKPAGVYGPTDTLPGDGECQCVRCQEAYRKTKIAQANTKAFDEGLADALEIARMDELQRRVRDLEHRLFRLENGRS